MRPAESPRSDSRATAVAPCRLLSFLPSMPWIIGTCAKRGGSCAERAIEQDLLRRVRDVIVAAHHERDAHVDVVGDDGEIVDRRRRRSGG